MGSLFKMYCYFFVALNFHTVCAPSNLSGGNVVGQKSVYISFSESSSFGGLLNLTREG